MTYTGAECTVENSWWRAEELLETCRVSWQKYEEHLESKERFAIKKYVLIIGKKKNMQVLSHTFTYFSTQSPWTMRHFVVPWHQFTYSLLVPEGRLATQRAQILRYCKCLVTIWYTSARDTSRHFSYTSLILKCRFSRMMRFTFSFNASVMTECRPDFSASWTSVRPFVNTIFGHWPRS